MVDIVKKAFDIDVDYKMHVRLINKKLDSCHCMVGRSEWSKPIAMFVKMGFNNGFKYLFEALLNDAVQYTRNAEWSPLAVVFFYKFPSNLLRAVVLQFVLDF